MERAAVQQAEVTRFCPFADERGGGQLFECGQYLMQGHSQTKGETRSAQFSFISFHLVVLDARKSSFIVNHLNS